MADGRLLIAEWSERVLRLTPMLWIKKVCTDEGVVDGASFAPAPDDQGQKNQPH